MIEQANFTYSPLGKAFEKQTKTIENEGIKQGETLNVLELEENPPDLKSIEVIFPKEMRTNEINNELNESKEIEDAVVRKHLKYKISKGYSIFRNLKQ